MFKNNIMSKALFTILCIIGFISCSKHEIEDTLDSSPPNSIELGEKLRNPYSVKNMKEAYKQLTKKSRSQIPPIDIAATHLYVKFDPKTESELDIIKQDSTLNLYPYPLDYEIKQEGNHYYHDPNLSKDRPTYQYAAVTVDYVFPEGVDYSILEELFIPDEDSDNIKSKTLALEDGLAESLVDEALLMTNNITTEELKQQTRRSKWRPSGRITYYDEIIGKTIGLEGIKVKARRWFTTHTGFVQPSGYYACNGRFRRDANYSFDLERHEFKVHGEVKYMYNGPKRRYSWHYHFSRSNSQTEFFGATIFRAAYHYYYKNIGGLRRPPQNSFWKAQMAIKAYNKVNEESNANFNPVRRFLGVGSPIRIYNPQHEEDDIYATTIHELAHAAHWRMIVKEPGTNRHKDYHKAEDKMCESWACGVQWYLTKMTYNGYKGRYYSNSQPSYSNVVIDLIDNEQDKDNNHGKSSRQGDNVTGYSMYQIESALIGCDTWIKWRNNIKIKYNNETEKYIDQLFTIW